MICSACAKTNVDGISFCEFCGADLRLNAPTAADKSGASAAAPSAADVAKLGKSLLGSLSLGEKFTAAGVLSAFVGFFLPWISTPDLGPLGGLLGQAGGAELSHVSYSGVDLSKVVGAVYLILLASVAAGILFYFCRKAGNAQKLLYSGFEVMIGSLFGPGLIVALLLVPMIQSLAGAGFWLLGLGFSSIAAGGLISIAALAKGAR